MINPVSPPSHPDRSPANKTITDPLWAKAQSLEATFLSEMLAYAGVGKESQAFGGGIGEEQFASFLRQEQAEMIVQRGGTGLAETLFHAMTERDHDKP